MPNIEDINGVLIADINAFSGVLKSALLSINGIEAGVSAPAVAYSVRLLDSDIGVTYTGPAMRVRRETAGGAGDDDEADIAFNSGVISLDSAISNASALVTATTLGQFLNVGTVNGTTYTNPDSLTVTASCFVDEWKDQSGNANHAEQTIPAEQPQIHSGTVNTDLILENGKPALDFDGSNDKLQFSASTDTNIYYGIFIVRQGTTGIFLGSLDTNLYWMDIGSGGTATSLQNGFNGVGDPSDYSIFRKNGATAFTTTTTRDDYKSAFYDGNQVLMSAITDGSSVATGALTSLNLGSYTGGGFAFNGTCQEFIMYKSTTSSQSSIASGVENNINSNYLIYQPTDAPTSGLLATYTGAAVAYSVRQLSDKAVICMRIRRDMGTGNPGDDDETNIGFDANGDLDTQAISDFCGTGTGYVTRWWDQSTNGNHADQPVGGTGSNALQPQIYNGTAVITQNGKPAVTFNSDKLVTSSITNTDLCTTNAHTSVTVFNDTSSSGFKGVWGTDDRVIDFVTRLGNTNWQYSYDSSSTPELRGYTAAASDYNRQNLSTVYKGSTNGYWRLNGSQIDSGAGGTTVNTGTTNLELGESVNLGFTGNLQEVISWPTDYYNNRTAIESNVNTYFQIPGM